MKMKFIIIFESIVIFIMFVLIFIMFLSNIVFPIEIKKEIPSLSFDEAIQSFNSEMVQELENNVITIDYYREGELTDIQLGCRFLDFLMGFDKSNISFVKYKIIDDKYCYVQKDTLFRGCASVLYEIETNIVIGYIIDDKPIL